MIFRLYLFATLASGIGMATASIPAAAQTPLFANQLALQMAQPSIDAPPAIRPVPGQLEMSQLIWSTMITVENANRTANYSVLRQSGSQAFQIGNAPEQLAQVFSGLRATGLDLSTTLLVPPTDTRAPQVLQDGIFRVQGLFQLRPRAIGFDLYYQWEQGRWKIYGIDIIPLKMMEQRDN